MSDLIQLAIAIIGIGAFLIVFIPIINAFRASIKESDEEDERIRNQYGWDEEDDQP